MQQFIDDAELQHENQNYYGAYDSYRIATKFDESRMDLWYGQGENARLYTAYETALGAYNHVLLNAAAGDFPELQFRLGQVQQFLGNYEEAVLHYEQYLSQPSAGQENREAAEKNLEDSRWAASRILEADDFEVTHLPIAINSEYSDFAYRPNGDSSFFSSNRILYEQDELNPPRYLSRIFRVMDGNPTDPGQLKHTILEEGKHMAHTSFNAAQSRAYYTICEYLGDTEEVRCDLFFSSVDTDGQWGPPVVMNINVAGANNTQPQVVTDPVNGGEMLYFASDRDGGLGGLDLYRAPLNDDDGMAGTVENLSRVNSEGDDYTPFFDSQGCRLYFSTDGRNTLGGFDVYYAHAKDGFGEPVHLNHPVNGSMHDRYYIIAREDDKAYFSSNRQGEEAIRWPGEENACCDDIYSVPFDETVILDVYTYRELDETNLDYATVELYRVDKDVRELVETQTQPTSNHFIFEIQPRTQYELRGTRIAFGPDEESADLSVACEVPESNRITRNLYLPQKLIVNVFDEKTREPLNGARVLLANSETETTNPIADETKENSNRFEYLVRLDNPYFVYAERDAYMPNDTSFTIPEAGVNEMGEYEVDIYLRQPNPIDLVPVNLYFDNDHPHPSSRRVTSDIQYVTTNERYYARKGAFIDDLIKPEMSDEEEFLTREQLNDFFENDVLGGRERLIELAGLLLERLELGTTYEMTVEGNASKRGNPAYNLNLSQRRVDSVLDFFRQYNGGVLNQYIDSGALSFVTAFAGDSKADPNDRSVFGLQASRSRRVTITDLKATN
ncbi:MAG: hypothetical protein AAF433_05290 [Bacteroidota bacterium]